MLRRIVCVVYLAVLSVTASAQELLLFSQYMTDASAFNPAYVGSQGALTISAQARKQWVKLEGSPFSQVLSIHSPISKYNLAAGLRITNDRLGVVNMQKLAPALAYKINLGKERSISAGLQVALQRYDAQFSKLRLNHQDDKAFDDVRGQVNFSIGAGLFFGAKDFYIGMAVPNLMPEMMPDGFNSAYIDVPRKYILHAGYVFPLSGDLKLKPNVLVNYPERGVAYADLNMNLLVREVLWVGMSYRTDGVVSSLLQFQLTNQLAFGYSYDAPLTDKNALTSDSHEFLLQYRFYFIKSGVQSPRYF